MGELLRAVGNRGSLNLPSKCEVRAGDGQPEGLATDEGLECQDPSPDLARPTTAAPGHPAPPAFILAFSAHPTDIQRGRTTTVQWHTVFASRVFPNGQPVSVSGSSLQTPQQDTNFELVAKGIGPEQKSALTVTVLPPPRAKPTSPPVAPDRDDREGGPQHDRDRD